jgi:hypothetical protein
MLMHTRGVLIEALERGIRRELQRMANIEPKGM